MAVTIKDVAKLAGVSPSTVSRVCNNNPTISKETRERVQKAVQELGYELTVSQDSQPTIVSKNIGVILPPSAQDAYENTFYLKAIRGISQICNQRRANTCIVTGQDYEEVLQSVQNLHRSGRVDGFIVLYSRKNDIVIDYLCENGFIELETPILIKSTPEGARDYLVPSRVHKGSFYALPQSPQLYKQLSMVAGFDKYFQIARCFRDEDLRADRQPEFTQIDMEMSFVDTDDVLNVVEGLIKHIFKDCLDVEIPTPLPRYTYRECMERFGSDKPDLRFGMEIINLNEAVKGCTFPVFANAVEAGGSVRALNLKGYAEKLSRKEIDKLAEYAKGCGAKGLAWVKRGETDGGSFLKHMTEDELNAIYKAADCEKGDILLILADNDNNRVLSQLGQLRVEAANRLGIERSGYNFLWVVEMPFFEYDYESGEWVAMHHPFTSPLDECIEYLDTDKAKVRAKAYDLVLNGIELSSGSIRITDPKLQAKIFELLGLSDEEAKIKFGYLLEAFRYGAPPHGGMGIGLDRLVMQMVGATSLRDVVAFPKMQNAKELMTDCPAEVPAAAIAELGIQIVGDKKED